MLLLEYIFIKLIILVNTTYTNNHMTKQKNEYNKKEKTNKTKQHSGSFFSVILTTIYDEYVHTTCSSGFLQKKSSESLL
ncbi:unnamed protein product [Rotaria socialis]